MALKEVIELRISAAICSLSQLGATEEMCRYNALQQLRLILGLDFDR